MIRLFGQVIESVLPGLRRYGGTPPVPGTKSGADSGGQANAVQGPYMRMLQYHVN